MKHSMLLVLLIAVLTVNALYFPSDPDPQNYNVDEEDLQREKTNFLDTERSQDSESTLNEPKSLDFEANLHKSLSSLLRKSRSLHLEDSPNITTSDCKKKGGECMSKRQCNGEFDAKSTCDGKKDVCCIPKGKGASELMVDMLSNAILIQGMALESMKDSQENALKNITKAISDQIKASETWKSNISDILSNQINASEIWKSNFSDIISNQINVSEIWKSNFSDVISNKTDVISNKVDTLQLNQAVIMSNLSDGFSKEEDVLQDVKDNQDIIISNLTQLGCPKGFFSLTPSSSQCFKYFFDQYRNWTEAGSKCVAEGLIMAKPSDPVIMQKYLVTKYSNYPGKGWPYIWLPARGAGSSRFQWQPNGGYIYSNNPYWHSTPSSSAYSSTNCMYSLNHDVYLKSYPNKPYWYTSCSSNSYTLCELVKN